MSAVDLALVREFKRRSEQALPGRIVRVMLYGSRARGDARADSDWDIAVFVSGEPTPNDRHVLSDIGFDLMIEQGHVHAFAIDRLAKADRFLKQMALQSPQTSPEATIHLAYYAMLHAAAAVLL